jgi:lipopolysaccharide export LptBFGC system permease protein LptF
MPRLPIIDRYIAKEIVAPFALGVALLTFALVTGRLLKLTEMVVNRGVTLGVSRASSAISCRRFSS